MISGISERPQPRDLPPPNPLSASNRRAPSRGCFQRSLAASSEKEAISHKPPPGVNSKHAVECGATLSPLRSTAALERTLTRNGPCAPPEIKHSLAPSMAQFSSAMARPAINVSTTFKGTKRAPLNRTLGDAGGGQTFL